MSSEPSSSDQPPSEPQDFTPQHLGKASNQPVDEVDLIPWTGGRIAVHLECSEFTSLCPVTGHPDFATLDIDYEPGRHLVETKSLKLYLWRYRERPAFNESLVDEIAEDLYRQLRPTWLRLVGRFHPRGGIAVTVRAERGETAPDQTI
ncbi:MAG: preQ(1) synthase [Acidobacteriota bacterium]